MKKSILLIVCIFIMCLFIGCGQTNEDSCTKNSSDDHIDTVGNNHVDNIGDLCVDIVSTEEFEGLEEFISNISQRKNEESIAELNTLKTFYVLNTAPEGYTLYKICAGIADIGFWYMPEEDTQSRDTIMQGESQQKHFLFISSRGTYNFGSILSQYGASTADLINGKYLVVEKGAQDIIFWEQDGEVLMLYVPAELNYTDVLAYCTASKYVRNEETQTFELEEKNQ